MDAMTTLSANLKYYNIPFEIIENMFGGCVLKYPCENNWILSVAFHEYSYGYKDNLLEYMGLNYKHPSEKGNDVLGFCAPSYVLTKILQYEHCKSKKGFE